MGHMPETDTELLAKAEQIVAAHKAEISANPLMAARLVRTNQETDGVGVYSPEERHNIIFVNAREYLHRVKMKRAKEINLQSREHVISSMEPSVPAETVPALDTGEKPPSEVTETVATPETTPSGPLNLDSNNLRERMKQGKIPETPSGLMDYVALFGSTWESLQNTGTEGWRERWALQKLHADGLNTYNPRMDKWEEVHAKEESAALSTAAVLAFRIENSDIQDGSLGSLVEIGMALYSAVLRGQRIVISIEEGIEGTLTDPGARAQLAALKESLREFQQDYPEHVVREDNPDHFLYAIREAVRQQKNEAEALVPVDRQDLIHFFLLQNERLSDDHISVVFGGSGDAFTTTDQSTIDALEAERREVEGFFPAEEGYDSTYLYRGVHQAAWNYAYGTGEEADFIEAFRTENEIKDNTDIAVNVVSSKARGMGFLNEIGSGLLKAKSEGQPYALLIEDFDPDFFIQVNMTEPKPLAAFTNEIVTELHTAGEKITDADRKEATDILYDLQHAPETVTFKRLKKSVVIQKTRHFRALDNTRRVRVIAQEQMQRLAESMPPIELPTFEDVNAGADYTSAENAQMRIAFEALQKVKTLPAENQDASPEGQQFKAALATLEEMRRKRLTLPTAVPLFIFDTDRERFKGQLHALKDRIAIARTAAKQAA